MNSPVPRPAPATNSPQAAARASFSAAQGSPSPAPSCCSSGTSVQPGKVWTAVAVTRPAATAPAQATPMAAACGASGAASTSAAAITASGVLGLGVRTSARRVICPACISATRMEVPPISRASRDVGVDMRELQHGRTEPAPPNLSGPGPDGAAGVGRNCRARSGGPERQRAGAWLCCSRQIHLPGRAAPRGPPPRPSARRAARSR
ncbi:hypothetical protein DESA109040_19950 [Deinococcus saxicola]